MKDKSVDKYLLDILECIDAIKEFSKGIESAAGLSVRHLERSAIERKLEIIGEALVKAKKVDENLSITNVEKIKNTRNIIVHDYDGINYRIIWDVIKNHLTILRKEIEQILDADHIDNHQSSIENN